ncbi:MAG: hypothetical protein IJ763_09690 [Lachnospiraceae bacterium]|nr:hypothetical protein [Lachnospiraceae bacterium]
MRIDSGYNNGYANYYEQLQKRMPDNSEEKTTMDTDRVDKEIERLKEKKAQLEQRLHSEKDERKKSELESQLNQIEMELLKKDNDNYRRENAVKK